MDYRCYERKINDVIMKCPIEAGVEILVYNVLDSVFDPEKVSLVDVSSFWKNRDKNLKTKGGIADIAMLSPHYEYRVGKGPVYGFIEVKAPSVKLAETKQVRGQREDSGYHIFSNGLVWKLFHKDRGEETIVLAYDDGIECMSVKGRTVSINEEQFDYLIGKLREMKFEESFS